MKEIFEFTDILGNVIQIRTSIDTFRQIENKPCWIVESRKIFPIATNWDYYYPLSGTFYSSDDAAREVIMLKLEEYKKNSELIGKNIVYECKYI